jgi:hypothetical protein
MLQQRNSYEGVNKLRVNRLTLPGRLTSLESTLAGSWLPRWASWLFVAMVVSACAGMGGVNKDSPPDVKAAVVKERSQARWQALIKGDLDAAYTYLSPASKAATSLDAYKRRIRPGLKAGRNCGMNGAVYRPTEATYDIPRQISAERQVGIERPGSSAGHRKAPAVRSMRLSRNCCVFYTVFAGRLPVRPDLLVTCRMLY